MLIGRVVGFGGVEVVEGGGGSAERGEGGRCGSGGLVGEMWVVEGEEVGWQRGDGRISVGGVRLRSRLVCRLVREMGVSVY